MQEGAKGTTLHTGCAVEKEEGVERSRLGSWPRQEAPGSENKACFYRCL